MNMNANGTQLDQVITKMTNYGMKRAYLGRPFYLQFGAIVYAILKELFGLNDDWRPKNNANNCERSQ